MAAAQAFLGGQELQLGDISPFVNPQEADFCIGWHRDMNWYSNGADPDFSEAAERAGTFSQAYGSILTVILHINDVPCCWNQCGGVEVTIGRRSATVA